MCVPSTGVWGRQRTGGNPHEGLRRRDTLSRPLLADPQPQSPGVRAPAGGGVCVCLWAWEAFGDAGEEHLGFAQVSLWDV